MKSTRAYVINLKKAMFSIIIWFLIICFVTGLLLTVKKENIAKYVINYSLDHKNIYENIPALVNEKGSYNGLSLNKLLSIIFNENIDKPTKIFADKIFFIKCIKDELSNQYNFLNESNNYFIPKIFNMMEKDESINYYTATEKTINSIKKNGNYLDKMGITVDNKTTYSIDLNKLFNEKIKIAKVKEKPKVLIVHTHGSESYNPTDRSEDINNNIVRVGREMKKVFKDNNIDVVHSEKMHDIPKFNNSYKNSLATVNEMLLKYPDISVVLDIHRDAMISDSGEVFKVANDVNGVKCSQVMFVVGTDEGGLSHPNWRENLKFAIHCQKRLNELAPNIARPINIRQERFNQHTTNCSVIIEIGTNGNTLIESINSAKITAKAISDVINMH